VIIYPAIDLKDGQAVRLLRGAMDQATVFNPDPAAQALAFQAMGFEWLHLVDLDGAFAGRAANAAAVRAILSRVAIPVQLGGGIRDMAAIEGWLDAGVARVILGTAAVKNPELVRGACARFPGRILVGIDARDGMAAVEGWAETAPITALDLALRFEDVGVTALIYTDINRDGAMEGVNAEGTAALARRVNIPVIASGGVASMADLSALKRLEGEGIGGVICGRALYDGRIDPAEARALLAAPPSHGRR
jgi:phosphoribosylformimino-5-aminoimidazole carboxamide ribotide isomerase